MIHHHRLRSALPRHRPLLARFTPRNLAVRVLTVAVAIATVTGVIALAQERAPLLMLATLYVFVVLPAAMLWGFGTGVVVALIGFLICAYFFLPPTHSIGVRDPTHMLALVFDVSAAGLGALLGSTNRRRQELLSLDRAALGRLVAQASERATPAEVFDAIAEETGLVVGARIADVVRFEPDGSGTIVARWTAADQLAPAARPVGQRLSLEGENTEALVLRSGRTARIDSFALLDGPIAAATRAAGIHSEVGAPIVVDGRVWGAIVVATTDPIELPKATEARLANFAEIAAGAVWQAEARAALRKTRERIVESADEARRRIERDLHDGVQHQLITLGLRLNEVLASTPAELTELRTSIERTAGALEHAVGDLRTVSRGLQPPVLVREGLEPALRALLRTFPFPIEFRCTMCGSPPDRVREAAYFVVSESLTNVAKHAQARGIAVAVSTDSDQMLEIVVEDDGLGGADPGRGTGLRGIEDRLAAIGGWLEVLSPAGTGTRIVARMPLGDAPSAVVL